MNTTVSKNTVIVYTTLDKTFVEALCGKFTDSQPKEKRIVFEVLNQEKEMLQADCIIGEATLLQQKAAEGSLQKISAEYADMLPAELKGNEEKGSHSFMIRRCYWSIRRIPEKLDSSSFYTGLIYQSRPKPGS